MNKVGAIGGELCMMAGFERGTQNCQTLTRSQRPGLKRMPLRVRSLASGSVSLVGASPLAFLLLLLLLRERGTSTQAEQQNQQDAFGREPHSPFYNPPS
jgi:hypothetical protein